MAPEVYREEKYGASVDIYSLGIVLYRFLNNNRAPFMPPYPEPITFKSRENAIYRRMSGETIPFPSCPDKTLSEIVLRACAYDAKNRYSDASEMREALEAWKSGGKPASFDRKPESNSISFDSVAVDDDLDDKTIGVFSAPKSEKAWNDRHSADIETQRKSEHETDSLIDASNSTTRVEDIPVGGLFSFGHYKGQNIDWIVLDKNDETALLISRYALDCKRFNDEYNDASWEFCTLRWWLNNDFVMEAFNEDERRAICDTELKNDINPKFATNSGDVTNDKVFLLSMEEATKLLSDTRQRSCEPTEYTRKR